MQETRHFIFLYHNNKCERSVRDFACILEYARSRSFFTLLNKGYS